MALQVLAELKSVFKADVGLELNVSKTVILPKGITQWTVFDVSHSILTTSPALTHLTADVALVSFCPEGFVGIGVPIVTDGFVRSNSQCLKLQLYDPLGFLGQEEKFFTKCCPDGHKKLTVSTVGPVEENERDTISSSS